MPQLTQAQAQKLITLIADLELAKFFEEIHTYGIHSPEITHFEREFMSGRYSFDFYERLTAFVNANAATSFVLENPKFDIFFSFSKYNQEEAENAVATLRRAGLNVFFSNDTLQDVAGSSFLPKINHALKNSQHFVLLCTPKAMEADWVVYEYETFFKEAYIKSRQQRKLFILEGEGFSHNLLDDTLSSIQTSAKVAMILAALGKEIPSEDDLAERKLDYKEFFEICFVDAQISEKERKQLEKRQKDLQLNDKDVAKIEATVHKEREKIKPATPIAVALDNQEKVKAEAEKLRLEQEKQNTTPTRPQQNQTANTVAEQTNSSMYSKILLGVALVVVSFFGFKYLSNSHNNSTPNEQKNQSNQSSTEPSNASNSKQNENTQGFVYEVVAVEGGSFEMGYHPKRDGKDNLYSKSASPQHTAQVKNFAIGKYEVTQGLWQQVMQDKSTLPANEICENCPVAAHWDDIQLFITTINQKYPPANGGTYRLPTEEEWEYAARGGKLSKDFVFAGSNNAEEVAWYNRNSDNQTHEVGTKQANELGIYDMSGNELEWTSSYWTNGYGAAKEKNRYVLRGGACKKIDKLATNYARINDSPSSEFGKYGFRLVVTQ
jgi:formylglycine-generating enzyme required for sulfatase activity